MWRRASHDAQQPEDCHTMCELAQPTDQKRFNRRSFLGYGAAATAVALVPGRAQAAVAKRPERILSLFHTHTGERLKIAYCCDGVYQPEALTQLNHLLRDF